MGIKVTIQGYQKIRSRFKMLDRGMRSVAGLWLTEAARDVKQEAQRLILSPPKTGRLYKRYRPQRLHQASAPGQPPAEDQGTLRRSIDFEVNRRKLEASVFSQSTVAQFLEFGTRRILPRPFLRPSLRVKEKSIATRLIRRLKRYLRSV